MQGVAPPSAGGVFGIHRKAMGLNATPQVAF